MSRSIARCVCCALWCLSLAGAAMGQRVGDPAADLNAAEFDLTRPLMTGQPMERAVVTLRAAVEREDTPEARFALGIGQTLLAVEHLGQAYHKHGMGNTPMVRNMGLPWFQLPVPPVAEPAPISIDGLREVLDRFERELVEAEATLAGVKAERVKLAFAINKVRIDLDGNGEASEDESFASIWEGINSPPQRQMRGEEAGRERGDASDPFVMMLDGGDVKWLQGYCHLMMGMIDTARANDGTRLFNHTAHLVFPNAEGGPAFLTEGDAQWRDIWSDPAPILDAIAFIHLLDLPVQDKGRLEAALAHFERVPQLSRESWDLILAEEDDDREWIPNPTQTPVLGPEFRVTKEQVQAWLGFLDEVDAVLAGDKLIPFWRGTNPKRGVNLRKVFEEPTQFDLVLWVQGTAAVPYLDEGKLTTPEFWNQTNRALEGILLGFAVWFN